MDLQTAGFHEYQTLLSDQSTYFKTKINGLIQSSKFTWKKTAEQTLEVYKKCLNE